MTRIEKELIKFYLDWVNDYLSPATMAEHYCLPEHEVMRLIDIGRALHERNVKRIVNTRPKYQDQYTNIG